SMLAYAAADTAHLPPLRAALWERLVALGRLGWAEEEFQRLEDLRWTGTADDADAYLRVKGAKALPPRQLAALRELYRWRETLAARNRVAAELRLDPGVLCGRPTLEAVARAVTSPNDRAGLAQIGELRRWQTQVLGDALLAALG